MAGINRTSPDLPLPGNSRVVEDELLELYAKHGPRVPVPVMLAALVIAALAWNPAPKWMTITWVAAVAMVLVIRGVVIWWLPRTQRLSLQARLGLATAVSALGGTVHGASVIFWPYLGPLEHSVQSMFVLGLCAGAVATEMGYMPVFAAYLLPMLTPLAFTWAEAVAAPGGAWYRGASGVMMVLFLCYGGLLCVLARDTFRLYSESFNARKRLSLALEQAEAANRAKTRFLASASHDLRQPMHTLTLFGAALSMRPLDASTQAIVTQMGVAMRALGTQLDALLDVSKLDAGVMPVHPIQFSLSNFLSRLGDEFAPVAGRRGLRLSVEIEGSMNGYTDPMLLERVLRNLIDNAIKYTEQGSVTIEGRQAGEVCEIRVRDTGAGIPQPEQERVFEEFYQIGNPERDRTQGLGLGLSIVRRLAELLQLDMSMQSAVGQGTEFVLRARSGNLGTTGFASQQAQPTASIEGLHVLVIDDEEGVRHAMLALLESLGCRASLAGGTQSAAELAQRTRPDIVLADFRLRGDDDGIAAVRRLRSMYPGLAALLVSGDTAPARLREADAAGLRLLHKPVQADILTNAIRDEVDRVAR